MVWSMSFVALVCGIGIKQGKVIPPTEVFPIKTIYYVPIQYSHMVNHIYICGG